MTLEPTCAAVAETLEAIADGDLTPDVETSAHLSTCAACRASLDRARRLDQLLRARAVPAPPPQFTARTMQRIRRAGWRREQIVDWVFNTALIAAGLLVASGLWIALQQTGLTVLGRDLLDLFTVGVSATAQRITPSLPLYAGATGLLLVALGLWWWASSDAAL
jgi:predicted anti-sigma-YlaC factor YlaD